MKTLSAIFFALATIVAGSTLSAVSSYAQTYSSDQQVCGFGTSSDDLDCTVTSSHKMGESNHVFHDRARADGHARSNGRAQ
ncbi:MAG TPA: hypothetical protein VN229_24910 [Terriglobales bacterium]|nr:hypothetical protein [Terriglobales bacterium]